MVSTSLRQQITTPMLSTVLTLNLQLALTTSSQHLPLLSLLLVQSLVQRELRRPAILLKPAMAHFQPALAMSLSTEQPLSLELTLSLLELAQQPLEEPLLQPVTLQSTQTNSL